MEAIMAAKKKATKKVHNDIDELPADETAEEFDDESPSDVLGIDVGKPEAKAKAGDSEEPDERPGEEVLAAVAAEAAKEADEPEIEEEEADEEGVSADADEPGADEDEEVEYRDVEFERDGEVKTVRVTAQEADILEGFIKGADTTRGQYAHLQDKYLEVIHGAPAQPAVAADTPAPAEAANARLNQMVGQIPQVVEAYTPIVNHIRDSLPEEHQLREFIEDNPMMATIIASVVDGQANAQAQARVNQNERFERQFKTHVDGLVNQIIQSDDANEVLGDSDVRDKFDAYLVSLGPIGTDGNHDPTPIRQTLAQDDGRWLAERWNDFQLRAALSGAKPVGGEKPPKKRPTDKDRRRAIDPSGGSRSGSRSRGRKEVFSSEVTDVLGAK
jgi:hypothetical protein